MISTRTGTSPLLPDTLLEVFRMIEGFFGKMTNQMLRGIRVQSKKELADRIYKYFDEVNATPVVHHWKYKMDEIDPDEKVLVGLAI